MHGVPKFRLLLALLLGVVVLLGAGDDSARINKLGHQMMCMCGCNYILLECNHVNCPYSGPMTKELDAAVADGKSDKDILAFFVDKYGPTVLTAPTKKGFDRVAWIMPYLALILGVGGVVLAVHSWHNRLPGPPNGHESGTASPDLARFRAQARKETEL